MRKTRASTSEAARKYRQQGHDDALEFALAIGMDEDYQNDSKAKKDVIDPSYDSHSVKGGLKKWQIFLYHLSRFENDFRAMNGMGELLMACINAFPSSFIEYQSNKTASKEKLRIPMKELCNKLQDKHRLKSFLNKSIFNGGEVNYLTVKHEGMFHVFLNTDVIEALIDNLEVCNSRAISAGQFPEQKVLFRYEGKNLGEVEMRNDRVDHYREIRFNMVKPRAMKLLFTHIHQTSQFGEYVLVYGKANKKFGRWKPK